MQISFFKKTTWPGFILLLVISGILYSMNRARVAVAQASSPKTAAVIFLPGLRYVKPKQAPSGGYFVAKNGTASGDGSLSHPWNIETALNGPSRVKPGDTIWIREGTYGSGGADRYNSMLKGAEGKPITVRAYPGERAVINGRIMVYGSWSIFWGLEVTNTDTHRSTTNTGSFPSDIVREDGFNVLGPNNRFINNIVHDQATGIGFGVEGVDSELYGNIVFNNGWQAPDRGHGYSIYAQNETGTKQISDNILFNNFGLYTLHIYGEKASLKGFVIDGNVFFNGQTLVGGMTPASSIRFTNNSLYMIKTSFGFDNQANQDLVFQNNRIWSDGDNILEIKWWQALDVTGNLIWNQGSDVVDMLSSSNPVKLAWNNNTYYSPDNQSFTRDQRSLSWSDWKRQTGFDGNSSYTSGAPSGTKAIVRKNQYESNRAHIIIFNWSQQPMVSVDVSSLSIQSGDLYTLYNAQNITREQISGIYRGNAISIPMTGWSIATPIGWNTPLENPTFPQFGVFVLIFSHP